LFEDKVSDEELATSFADEAGLCKSYYADWKNDFYGRN
jgi:hypothetical protein